MAEHRNLTGADLHEPKGVASASTNTAYFANGSGSGSWRKVAAADINGTDLFPNLFTLTTVIPDVSNVSSVIVAVPYASTLVRVTGVLGGPITVANSTVSVLRNGSGSAGTMTVTYTSSAKGDDTTINPSSNNTFAVGDYVEITSDGGSTGTATYSLTLVFQRTA